MSTLGHKRKRSLQDSPVDLTTMQVARKRLIALQEELSGIQETELEMEEIMKHVDALAVILGTGKKLKLSFSSVRRSDLTNMGLIRKPLRLNNPPLDDRKYSHITDKHVDDLCIQITRIRRTASKRFEAGARMILDAVLLAIADISLDVGDKLPVAIFPEMRITPSEGVLVKNPKAQFEVWLSGNVDYGVCTYEQETDRATVLQASLEDLMMYAKNRITLVEAKREQEMLADNMPEATSQAIALSEVTGNRTIRYCLSNGRQWMFAI